MDNVGIVVDDSGCGGCVLYRLGMELEGRQSIEGNWADRTVGLDGLRSEIAMMRIPDGPAGWSLQVPHAARASRRAANPPPTPPDCIASCSLSDDIDDTIARLRPHGATSGRRGSVRKYCTASATSAARRHNKSPSPNRSAKLASARVRRKINRSVAAYCHCRIR
jgi:hypothetical protein